MPEGMITKTSGDSSVVVNPAGARIQKLILKGHTILSTVSRGDGKEGSTHPCSPIFGPEISTSYGLPQHGPVRNSVCTVQQTDNSVTLTCPVESGTYPSGITMTQTIEIQPGVCIITTTHENTGPQEAPVNFGEHFYWNTPEGWDALTLNGTPVHSQIAGNQLISLPQVNTISISGLPAVTLRQDGYEFMMLWTYRSTSGAYDRSYACLEPVEGDPTEFFGSRRSMVLPQSKRTNTLRISI